MSYSSFWASIMSKQNQRYSSYEFLSFYREYDLYMDILRQVVIASMMAFLEFLAPMTTTWELIPRRVSDLEQRTIRYNLNYSHFADDKGVSLKCCVLRHLVLLVARDLLLLVGQSHDGNSRANSQTACPLAKWPSFKLFGKPIASFLK